MDFIPISINAYIEKCLADNPDLDVQSLRNSLNFALEEYKRGEKCSCGNDIWVIGSAYTGSACFKCITRESFPDSDYEIEEAINKNEDFHVDGFQEEIDYSEFSGFFDDDGNKLNPDLIQKPGLCLSCIHDDEPEEEILCILTRLDQNDSGDFKCYSYQQK